MKEKTPQDYANELLKMYRENEKAIKELNNPPIVTTPDTPIEKPTFADGTGGIQVNVTTLDRIYPVKGALVTIFTGWQGETQLVDSAVTDESGKSKVFRLETPVSSESQQSKAGGEAPYSSYNISVKSDGYVEKIALNVPVFSGVISVQNMDLLPITAAGDHISVQIINEKSDYNL